MTTAETASGAFTEAAARDALQRAAAQVAVPARDARLLRLGENAVFDLGDSVARVARPHLDPQIAGRTVAVARWLAEQGVPAVEALDVVQPVAVDGMQVTFWRSLGDGETYGTTSDLAHLLRRLHELDRPAEFSLPYAEPWNRAARRLASAELSDVDREFLVGRLGALRRNYDALDLDLPTGVIHEDANVGNVLVDAHGVARLIDLDGFSIGPREWDLVLTAMYFERYGWHTREEYETFVEIYGFDVMTWAGYEVLADLRELIMVTWMSQNIGHDERVAVEFAKRIQSIRTGASRQDWRPF